MTIEIINNNASLKIIKRITSRSITTRLVLKSQIKGISVASGNRVKLDLCGCSTSCLYINYSEVTDPATASVVALRDAISNMMPSGSGGNGGGGDASQQMQVEQSDRLMQIRTAIIDLNSSLMLLTDALQKQLADKSTATKQNELIGKVQEVKTVADGINSSLQQNLSGKATETKQDSQLVQLQAIVSGLDQLGSSINTNVQNTLSGKASVDKQNEQLVVLSQIKAAIEMLQTSTLGSGSPELFKEPLRIDTGDPTKIYKGYALPGSANGDPAWSIQRIETLDNSVSVLWAAGNRNPDKIWNDRATLTYS